MYNKTLLDSTVQSSFLKKGVPAVPLFEFCGFNVNCKDKLLTWAGADRLADIAAADCWAAAAAAAIEAALREP